MTRGSGRKALAAAACLALAGLVARPAWSQDPDLGRRLDRLQKEVAELRAIVFQGRDTGQPVVVKPAGPDPAVTALGQRLDEMSDTLTKVNGQIEVLTHDADQAHQDADAVRTENGELKGELQDLQTRVAKLEAAQAAANAAAQAQAQAQAAPQPAGAPPPPPPGPPDQGGSAAAAPSPPPPTPQAAYRHARDLMTAGDYAGAVSAFQAFIGQYPDSPEIPTAYYWLGESDSAREAYADAVPAYASALKGWPKASWAADATVKLSRALAETHQPDKACAALGEFDRRYRSRAPSAVKARADSVRAEAKCGS